MRLYHRVRASATGPTVKALGPGTSAAGTQDQDTPLRVVPAD